LGDIQGEIRAGAAALNVPLSTATLMQIIYEVEASCTSIVSENAKGFIFHGRNLDFDLSPVLRKLVINVEFQRSGKTVFYGTTFAGYVGLLTGMRPGAFSVSLNERDIGTVLENALEALFVPGTTTSALLIRNTLDTHATFMGAAQALADTSTAAAAYITVAGTFPGEGVVITRDRERAADMWWLNITNGNSFLVETNYDHWKPDGDGRRKTAILGMENCTSSTNSNSLSCLFGVLSTPNVLNGDTTYTTLMSASNCTYSTTIRHLE